MDATKNRGGRPRIWNNETERMRKFRADKREERERMKAIVAEVETVHGLIQKAAAQGNKEAARFNGETPQETLHKLLEYWREKAGTKLVTK